METSISRRAKVIIFWLLAGFTILGVTHFFGILTPFLWAAITAYVFQPLISVFVRRLHLPRPLVAIVIYIAIVATIVMGVVTVLPVLRQQGIELANQVPGIVETGFSNFEERFPNSPSNSVSTRKGWKNKPTTPSTNSAARPPAQPSPWPSASSTW